LTERDRGVAARVPLLASELGSSADENAADIRYNLHHCLLMTFLSAMQLERTEQDHAA